MPRLLAASLAVSVASLAVGVLSIYAAPKPPLLPNLASYFTGQHPKAKIVTFNGIRFACFNYYGRDGILTECFAVGRAAAPKAKPKSSGGPAA